jgi:hypothetical protein
MRPISVYCCTLGISALGALPLYAQLLPSPNSVLSQNSRSCVSGIAGADLIIAEISDESKTAPAGLKLETARNMMDEGDYKGCLTYIHHAIKALRSLQDGAKPSP